MITKRVKADYENCCEECWERFVDSVIDWERTPPIAGEYDVPEDFDARCPHNPPAYAQEVVLTVDGYRFEQNSHGWFCLEYDGQPWDYSAWGAQTAEPTLGAAEAKMRRRLGYDDDPE